MLIWSSTCKVLHMVKTRTNLGMWFGNVLMQGKSHTDIHEMYLPSTHFIQSIKNIWFLMKITTATHGTLIGYLKIHKKKRKMSQPVFQTFERIWTCTFVCSLAKWPYQCWELELINCTAIYLHWNVDFLWSK